MTDCESFGFRFLSGSCLILKNPLFSELYEIKVDFVGMSFFFAAGALLTF